MAQQRDIATSPYASRSPVVTRGGIVCSASPLAASAGARVLAEGGNAFDAAIAIAAAEAVTLPGLCGLGGEAFAILYQASTGKVMGLTSTGAAPRGATPGYYRSQGLAAIPAEGPLAVSPPGEVAAYQLIHDTFGTFPLTRLLEPAIEYAESGFSVPSILAGMMAVGAPSLARHPLVAKLFLKNGHSYKTGDLLVQRDLAGTLGRIAAGGAEEFYRGGLARQIARAFREAGGLVDEEALATHQPELYQPLATTYRGHTVLENRPPSQGMVLLETLNILEGFDMASLGYLSPESIHLMVEAKKLAFADRNAYLGDPRVQPVPLDELLSKEHAAKRRALIDPRRASRRVPPAALHPWGSDTSYFCVADKDDNAVSFIHSLYGFFGSAFVVEGTGIVFNSRQRGFRLQEGHPNSIAPGKRPMHTLNAFMVLKDGKLFLVGGTPGVDFQVQGNAQVITGILDYGVGPQEVVESPRWLSLPGSDPDSLGDPYVVQLEPWMPLTVARGLEALGHGVTWGQEGISHGVFQLIQIDQTTGVKSGASDPRGDGHAAAA